MSFYPSRRHDNCPRVGGAAYDPEGDRAFVGEWLAHVAAGRIGGGLGRAEAAPPADGAQTLEEIRAVTLANERLICGDGRLPIW